MAFTRDTFLARRPWLYHFTTPQNVGLLRAERAMLSAAAWVDRANTFNPQIDDPEGFLGAPRLVRRTLDIGTGRTVTLNDQLPLQYRNYFHRLHGTYEDFLRCLNGYVFFWPGTYDGARPKGRLPKGFAKKYAAFGVLRVPSQDAWTSDAPVRFCLVNSGAPVPWDGVTRGPHIFVSCEAATFDQDEVAEVVFPNCLILPDSTQWMPPGQTQWVSFVPPLAAEVVSPVGGETSLPRSRLRRSETPP